MMESAVFVGGWPAFFTALGLSFLLATNPWMGNKGQRYRLAGFFLAWQMFTPIRPFWPDILYMTAGILLMEFFYGLLKKRHVEVEG